MNVAAFVISMFGEFFLMMQGGCVMLIGNFTSNLGEQMNDTETQNIGMDASVGGILIFIVSMIAIIGASLALKRSTALQTKSFICERLNRINENRRWEILFMHCNQL